MNFQRIRALTLDLDDTLWPVWPAIERAERTLHDWLSQHAVATATRFDVPALRALRDDVARRYPQWAHDLSALRRESLRAALQEAGDDAALAEPAFEVFFTARHQVDLFPDVLEALRRLSSAYPLLALTNGNADLARVGLAHSFRGALSAREFGVGKPDPRIFVEACRRLGCEAADVLHIGDDWALDVEGARAAGLQTLWVQRRPAPGEAVAGSVANLLAVADLLGC
ncbi:HAD family hydrolase [Piscinibacter sp.]|uniref:HAD family hydrolase n=1 Tax=Piscinibacter sp. TaxID=1903157 RepID=UPI00355AC401